MSFGRNTGTIILLAVPENILMYGISDMQNLLHSDHTVGMEEILL